MSPAPWLSLSIIVVEGWRASVAKDGGWLANPENPTGFT
jgi:hypothetical protein